MKRRFLQFSLLSFMIFAFATWAGAEETKSGMNVENLKKALGLSIYVQGGYTYNFENPDLQENDLRVFDHKSNSFTLDLAQIYFLKEAQMGGVGFGLKLSAGETAKWIHSSGLGEGDDPFDLTEAYVEYLAPLDSGVKITFGKFVTFLGAEVIEAAGNPNYSRSLLFNYAIAFTHTGLKMNYSFSDALDAGFYLVNGWDNTDDNNKGKTLGLSIGVNPIEQLSMLFNVMYGPEQDSNTSNNRFLFDWVGTVTPAENLSVNVNFDYGKEEEAIATGDAKWYGVAAIVKYDFTDAYSLAVRGEYFNDKDGVRTGTEQKLKEITITPEIRLAEGLVLRPEYRHDWSDKDVFDSATNDSQDTIALGVMYTW